MSVDGRDESPGEGGAEAGGLPSPQVPSQGGRAKGTPAGSPEAVPTQRDRREWHDSGVLPPPIELPPADAELIERMRSGDDTAYDRADRADALGRRHRVRGAVPAPRGRRPPVRAHLLPGRPHR
ncbi:hypothetical protein QF035_005076 [Streptomyces umbrinus]|uniref:Uncharacterized protein n=1 Tax=Streptomyces umbrinus TaxID=67370 RepID=A0ABU0SVB9_9ACTN|nr:hypothetical protein [Streptomyces umbrinus]